MNNMDGKIVLITGAKGGLGTFVTEKFLEHGATVVGTSRSIKKSDFSSPKFSAMPVDFSRGAAVSELANQVASRFGKIDVLAHVLGGFAGGQPIAETDDKTWEQMRDQNLTATFYILRAVIPHMRKAKYGRIVAVGSLAAVEPHAGIGAYVASKVGLATLVRTAALENADANITANVVLPGTMDTPANRAAMPNADFSKWVQPREVAKLIFTLSLEDAAQISNAIVPIEGH
jgi:NAD(P)-dependent dehydrogenase (short-subunit alcohol dehydrogenase family)